MIGPRSPIWRQKMAFQSPFASGRHLIAFDPGGVTGWSRITLRDDCFNHSLETILDNAHWVHGQIDCRGDDFNRGAQIMRKLVDELPTAAVVSESFFVRQMAADLTPVRLNAIVEHHLWLRGGRVLHQQQASQGKRINDERLKLLGAYTSEGGLEHARDADRHLVMMLRRCMDSNGKKMQARLWPQFT